MRSRFATVWTRGLEVAGCAAVLAVACAACGSSASSTSAASSSSAVSSSQVASSTHSVAPSTSSTSAAPSGNGTAAVHSGPVHATLVAENHSPKVNVPWTYSVTVTDAAGHPLTGTVDVQFVYGGQVVGRDTPPTHPLKNGHWHDNLEFPAEATAIPLTFQTVVHTKLGSVTLDWPVTVTR
jgi:hypothetical protein